ncbi:MAG: hypothetical protein H6733_12040 [Alphaproteobacteria bacterium]|nr:hypothetical protein [Alphaproteobacteria bacterium]
MDSRFQLLAWCVAGIVLSLARPARAAPVDAPGQATFKLPFNAIVHDQAIALTVNDSSVTKLVFVPPAAPAGLKPCELAVTAHAASLTVAACAWVYDLGPGQKATIRLWRSAIDADDLGLEVDTPKADTSGALVHVDAGGDKDLWFTPASKPDLTVCWLWLGTWYDCALTASATQADKLTSPVDRATLAKLAPLKLMDGGHAHPSGLSLVDATYGLLGQGSAASIVAHDVLTQTNHTFALKRPPEAKPGSSAGSGSGVPTPAGPWCESEANPQQFSPSYYRGHASSIIDSERDRLSDELKAQLTADRSIFAGNDHVAHIAAAVSSFADAFRSATAAYESNHRSSENALSRFPRNDDDLSKQLDEFRSFVAETAPTKLRNAPFASTDFAKLTEETKALLNAWSTSGARIDQRMTGLGHFYVCIDMSNPERPVQRRILVVKNGERHGAEMLAVDAPTTVLVLVPAGPASKLSVSGKEGFTTGIQPYEGINKDALTVASAVGTYELLRSEHRSFNGSEPVSVTVNISLSDTKSVEQNFSYPVEKVYWASVRAGLGASMVFQNTWSAVQAPGTAQAVVRTDPRSPSVSGEVVLGMSFYLKLRRESELRRFHPALYTGVSLVSIGDKKPRVLQAIHLGPEFAFSRHVGIALVASLRFGEAPNHGYEPGRPLPATTAEIPTHTVVVPTVGIVFNLSPSIFNLVAGGL